MCTPPFSFLSDFAEIAVSNAKEYMWAISVMTGGDDFLKRAGTQYAKNHGGKKRPLDDKLEKLFEVLWSQVCISAPPCSPSRAPLCFLSDSSPHLPPHPPPLSTILMAMAKLSVRMCTDITRRANATATRRQRSWTQSS